MKLFLTVLIIALSVYFSEADTASDVCAWQTARNNIIRKLTPNGQKIMNQMLLWIQSINGAALQPQCNSIGAKYNSTLTNIMASTDSALFSQLKVLIGCNGIKSGAGPLQDVCAIQKKISAVVAKVSATNQPTVVAILNEFNQNALAVLRSVLSVNSLVNDNLIQQLVKSENDKTLADLEAIFNF